MKQVPILSKQVATRNALQANSTSVMYDPKFHRYARMRNNIFVPLLRIGMRERDLINERRRRDWLGNLAHEITHRRFVWGERS